MSIKALYTTKATATGGRDGQAATADGSFSVVTVQVRFERFKCQMMILGHKPFYAGYPAGDITGCGINLDPVAGRDNHPLNNTLELDQFAERLFNLVWRKSYLFTNLNCSSFMREADNNNIHQCSRFNISCLASQ